MTLRHLKIFVAICETGSVTAAGEKLFIAQPSVSHALSELEAFYGIKLFERISKRLQITEAGKKFLQYATHILGLFDDMDKEFKNYEVSGIIRIGASITIGNYLLPRYVKSFQELHAKMKVQVFIDNSETIEKYVLHNQVDIGLIEGNVHSENIKSEHFMDDELVLICSTTHPFARFHEVNIELLKSEDFILREKGSAGREFFEGIMAVSGIEITPLWESVSTQAIIRAVSAGLGISILPFLLVKDNIDRNEVEIIKMKDVSLKRKFNIIYHKDKFITQSVKDFMSLCT